MYTNIHGCIQIYTTEAGEPVGTCSPKFREGHDGAIPGAVFSNACSQAYSIKGLKVVAFLISIYFLYYSNKQTQKLVDLA